MKYRNYTIDFIILLSYAIFFIILVNYIMVNKLYLDDSINGKLDSNDICSLITIIDFICVYRYVCIVVLYDVCFDMYISI